MKTVNLKVCTYAKSALEPGAGITVVGAVKRYVDAASTLGHDGGMGVVLSNVTKYVGILRETGSLEI